MLSSFWQSTKIKRDPDQIWLNLCQAGPLQAEAVKHCKKFLRIYATARKRKEVSLGPEEYKTKQSVQSATTIVGYWRHLVQAVDRTLLAKKRKEDPHNKSQWSLRVHDGLFVDVKYGPIWEVTCWIKAKVEELGLTREQSFVKQEATPEDIVVVLKTLWLRAADIPCNPATRVAFHPMALFGGICGFRPGMLENLTYEQVALHLVLDPRTNKPRPVATFTVNQNKQVSNVIRKDQANVVDVSVVMQKSVLCIVSLVIARAFADDAFDTPVNSFQTLLSRPTFENKKRLRINWKENTLTRPIWPISYNTYWRLWTQTTFVAGYTKPIRPYSVRVGAGNRLNGALTPSLRNYILSHSSSTFEHSYQPRQIRENLMPILDQHAEKDTELHALLRSSSIDRDANAPIYVTKSEIDEWERTRDDLRICREQGDKVRRGTIIRKLSALRVEEIRQKYFQESNDLRLSGLSAADLVKPQKSPSRRKPWYGATAPLAAAVASLVARTEPFSLDETLLYVEKLVAYQKIAVTSSASPSKADAESTGLKSSNTSSAPTSAPKTSLWTARCILCAKAKPSKDLSALREHYEKVHKWKWDEPFSCPRCEEVCVIEGWNDWVAHIERHHGLENAPKRRPMVVIKCVLCSGQRTFQSVSGLSIHTSRCHKGDFQAPLACPECRRQGDDPPVIGTLSEWCSHVALSHGGPDQAPTPPATKFACLLCGQKIANEANHYSRKHSHAFDAPFSCPACFREGMADVPHIIDRNGWQLHCAAVHGKTEVVFGQQAHELARCLVCDKLFSKAADHFTKSHLPSLPFPCPECERLGAPAQQIQDRDGWIIHCAVAHNDVSAALASRTAGFHSKRKRKNEDDSAWEKRVKRELISS